MMLVTCMSIRIKERHKMVAVLTQISLRAPGTVARQAPVSMGFPRQEYWGGLPFPSPGDLPNPGIKPGSPALQRNSLPIELYGTGIKTEI